MSENRDYDDDIFDAFDNNQMILNNYLGSLERQEMKNRKDACRDPCIYSEDCPFNWDLNECFKRF